MKCKFLITLKSFSALFVSASLVLSNAGPATAKVGYMPEKCIGSKDVCDFWGSSDESTDGSWNFTACYKTKVSVKVEVKNGSKWKSVKGASAVGKKSEDGCASKYPYSISIRVSEKSKGTKTYRLVTTNKKKKSYANFKVKVSKYTITEDSEPTTNQEPTPSYSQETYDYIVNLWTQLKFRPGKGIQNGDPICQSASDALSRSFENFALDYKFGFTSEALALSKANTKLSELARGTCFTL